MKKITLNLLVILLAMFINFGCSSDKDDKNDTDLGLNITTPALDEKSGGVYFVSTYAGEYIFRLNLKNGNDLMICEMFNNDKYSDLTPEKRDWMPGENLTHFEFSKDDIQLLISLTQGGEPESKLVIDNNVLKTVAFKSTAKEPIKVYSGTTHTRFEDQIEPSGVWEEIMILRNKHYFYGLIESKVKMIDRIDDLNNWRYCSIFKEITELKDNKLTYDVPDHPNDPEGKYVWERTVTYSESKLELNETEELGGEEGTYYSNHLLLRRFQ